MRERRGTTNDRLLCAGPGRLTEALAITGADNGVDLTRPPFELLPPSRTAAVTRTTRIGITKAVEKEWRYVEAGSAAVSRKPVVRT
jgi:DNA-3-methyladenine glycosylase